MPQSNEHLLEQEVRELTEMLRDDPVLEGLRKALSREGFDTTQVLLAGFMEDEKHGEYGAIVTKSGEVYEYERSTKPGAPAKFKIFRCVEDVDKLIRDAYQAVGVALRQVNKGD